MAEARQFEPPESAATPGSAAIVVPAPVASPKPEAIPAAAKPLSAADLPGVVARYQGPLLRYVASILGRRGDQQQDVVQEAFFSLHRHVERHGPASVVNVAAWLWRV